MKVVRYFILILSLMLVFTACESGDGEQKTADEEPSKDKEIRQANLNIQEQQAKKRFACDTISVEEHIIADFPQGTYLVEFDRTYTYNVPKPAVMYHRGDKNYIFAVIAKSKEGERLIEPKNVVGYKSSYINLDSTKLGTAFFYLTLFVCEENNFTQLWEAEVPIHGGFSRMTMRNWKTKKMPFIELYFSDGIISGHRSYNYFFVDGIEKKPHLMETYLGIVHKRTLANVNNDKFPDYFEYRFYEDSLGIRIRDSIPFYWSEQRELYITDVNRRWWRKY
ncbi:MAG: hypothetical protein QY331_04740 [Melioribacteraceae bacterium]|jgi:hypothetical protein|nr:MAG: hypothetical protein QY331_04740 [Melioribacteraceae bacterium]